MHTTENVSATTARQGWNAGRMVGAKRALKPRQIWEIRFYLNQNGRVRDRALFDFAIDSKLRGCDVVGLKIGDLVSGGHAHSGDIHQPRNRTSRAAGRLLRCRYFVHCVIQPPTVSCHWTEFLALLWQMWIDGVGERFLTVWTSLGWRPREQVEDGLSDRWHAGLRRRSPDSFFSVPLP